jgi:hypothetical protein
MGQSMGDTAKAVTRGTLNAAAGGLNAASGTIPPAPVDFNGIGTAIKKARAPKTFTMNNPITSTIPKPDPVSTPPIFDVPDSNPNPMPDLYSGQNAQIPRLRKPINGMMPFYGK